MVSRMRSPLVEALLAAAVVSAASAAPADDCRQIVLVVVPDWPSQRGTLDRYDRDGASWRRAGTPLPVTIGRAGCGWGMGLEPVPDDGPRKREGDGRSPAGVFPIGIAFGAEESLDTGLTYRRMTAHDWCIDMPESPLYNRIVDDRETGADAVRGSTEPMRRDLHLDGDRAYSVGFVIGHNAGCEAGAGSCIFAHPWRDASSPTAGCTALAEPELRGLLRWLRADAGPRFVLLPAAEHRRLWRAWDLPPPSPSSPGESP